MRKLILTLTTTLLSGGYLFSQQDKLITHFIYDKMTVNPGETGLDQGICGTLLYRNQWDKVNGAPNSAVFNLEANMNQWFPGGLGMSFYHDAIGFNRQNNLLLNYSYPLSFDGFGTLGIGVGVGMINFSNNPVWVPPTSTFDNALPTGFGATNLDANFGLYWKGASDYYVGLSSTHLSESLLRSGDFKYQTSRTYYLMGGKTFRGIGPGDLDIQGIYRTDMVDFVSADINVRYIYDNMLYGGLTYRTAADAIGFMVGWMPIPNATIGYSYDMTLNKLAGISRGSHEIVLKYCIIPPPPPIEKSKHPRWL